MNSRFFAKSSMFGVGVVIALLIAAACGGEEPAATPTATQPPAVVATPTPTATSIPTPTPTTTPKRGGVIKENVGQDPNIFGPLDHASGGTNTHLARMYSNLVWNPQGNTLVPDAAESYAVSADGLTWTFKIRNNIKWHPGTPAGPRDGTFMTAQDVKYSFEKMMGLVDAVTSPRCGWIKEFVDIGRPDNGIEVVDGLTVKVHMQQGMSSIPSVLATGFCGMIPVGTNRDMLKQRPFGSGPFRLKSFQRGALWVYERNPEYFKPGLPYLDEIDLIVMTGTETVQSAFLTNRLDVSGGWPTSDNKGKYDEMIAQKKIYLQPYSTQCRPQGVFMNATKPPFSDPKLRQAVNLAIDRKSYITIMHNGYAAAHLLLDTDGFGRTEKEIWERPGYRQPHDADLAEAKRLMQELYPNGLDVKMPVESSAAYSKQGEFVANELNKIGIRAAIELGDSARIDDIFGKLNYALMPYWFCQATGVPEELMGSYFLTGGARNWTGYSNKAFDAAYLDLAATQDPAQKKLKARAMEDMVLNDMVVAPLPVHTSARSAWTYVHDLPITITQYNWSKAELIWRE